MMPTERGPIVIVSDRAAVAARLETLLRAASAARVVVATPSALPALASEQAPSVIIVAMSTAATTRMLATLPRGPRTPPVIVLADMPHEAWTARARRGGVRAVLRIDAGADELAAALAATRAGLLVVHPDAVAAARTVSVTANAVETPTPRELEVLEMMAEGMSNRAIAARLKISRHTVKFHVAALLTKLGARSRTEAVAAGVREGLISL
jgi:DNA-binding NarL/FixJ family response regulator